MNTRHVHDRIVIVVMLLVVSALCTGGRASAGFVEGSQAMSNGQTVTWADPWQPGPEGASGTVSDVVVLTNEWGDSTGYVIGEPGVASDVLLSRVSMGIAGQGMIQPVESGTINEALYALNRYIYAEETAGALVTVTLDTPLPTLSFVLATSTRFADAVEVAQGAVWVDGVPLLDGFDGADLQVRLTSEGTEASPEPLSGGEPSNAYLLGPSGAEVRFTDDWQLVEGSSSSIEINTIGPPPSFLAIRSGDAGGLGGDADAVSTMLEVSSGAKVIDAIDAPDGSVVVLLGDSGAAGPIYLLYEELYLPDSSVSVLLSAAPDDLPDALAFAQGTVMIDGAPVLQGVERLIPSLETPAD